MGTLSPNPWDFPLWHQSRKLKDFRNGMPARRPTPVLFPESALGLLPSIALSSAQVICSLVRQGQLGKTLLAIGRASGLALCPGFFEFPVPLGEDRLLPARQLVGRSDVANRTVKPDLVVILHIAFHDPTGILQRQRRAGPDAFVLDRAVISFQLAVALWIIRRSLHVGHAADANELFEIFQEGEGILNYPPEFSGLSIQNGSSSVSIDTSSVSITIEDPDGDSFNSSQKIGIITLISMIFSLISLLFGYFFLTDVVSRKYIEFWGEFICISNKIFQKENMSRINVYRVWSYMTRNKGFLKRTLDFISFMFSGCLKKKTMLSATFGPTSSTSVSSS